MSRHRLALRLLAAFTGLAVLLAAACGGGSEPGDRFSRAVTLGEGDIFPAIANHTLETGENRLSLTLIDRNDEPVLDAGVHLAFFDLNGADPVLKSEADARFIPVELSFVDEQSGGEKRSAGSGGVYVATVSFDRTGRWGVEVTVTRDGEELEPLPFQFDVLEETPEPDMGDPAPPSRQLTATDVDDISEIDSSFPPRPHMHGITIADALKKRKPLVIAFATPAFCESRTCGPVMDAVMDPLYEKYKQEALFIHIEPYELKELREGTGQLPVAATDEWGLQTEPWLFVVDAQGKIAGKFEGVTAADEVEAVLRRLLGAQ